MNEVVFGDTEEARVVQDERNDLLAKRLAKKKKTRDPWPQFTPEVLVDKQKGLRRILRTMTRLKLDGRKGKEAKDISVIVHAYEIWARELFSSLSFTSFLGKVVHLRNAAVVQEEFSRMRKVARGVLSLEELEEQEEGPTDRAEETVENDEDNFVNDEDFMDVMDSWENGGQEITRSSVTEKAPSGDVVNPLLLDGILSNDIDDD